MSGASCSAREIRAFRPDEGGRILDRKEPDDARHAVVGIYDYEADVLEAMALGKPVIATAYSGNVDFMTPVNSWLVDYEETLVGPEGENYPAHGTWAEPDVDHAAELMRDVGGTTLPNGLVEYPHLALGLVVQVGCDKRSEAPDPCAGGGCESEKEAAPHVPVAGPATRVASDVQGIGAADSPGGGDAVDARLAAQ